MSIHFCDDVFPPGRSSLVNEPQYGVKDPDYKKAVANVRKWLRPKVWGGKKPTLFKDNARPGDIQQNQLGDCWLLSAFSVVALHPGLLKKVFVHSDPKRGEYRVRLYHEGKWKIITVDDRIPCASNNKPIFGHCSQLSEIWVVILEKAFAKLMGSYECLDGGWMEEGIHMLTGGRCEKILIKDYYKSNRSKGIPKERMWNKLLKYDDERILMGCSIKGGSTREARNEKLGLVAGHAYGILDVYQTKDKKHKLIKIRNPWGQYEWRGRWSDRSSTWTLKYKKELNHLVREDGIFWISYQDFKKYFDEVSAVRMFNDDIMSFKSSVKIPPSEEVSFPNARWERARVKGGWGDNNAGGSSSTRGYSKNPRIRMTLSSKTRCFMLLTRPQLSQLSESRYYGYNICFTIHKSGSDHKRIPKMVNSNNDSLMVGPDFSRYVGIEIVLSAGDYIITPATDYSNRKGGFHFESFVSRGTVSLTPLETPESESLNVIPPTPRNEHLDALRISKRDVIQNKSSYRFDDDDEEEDGLEDLESSSSSSNRSRRRRRGGVKKSTFDYRRERLDKSHMNEEWKNIDKSLEDEEEEEEKKKEERKPKVKYQRFQSSYQMFYANRTGYL